MHLLFDLNAVHIVIHPYSSNGGATQQDLASRRHMLQQLKMQAATIGWASAIQCYCCVVALLYYFGFKDTDTPAHIFCEAASSNHLVLVLTVIAVAV